MVLILISVILVRIVAPQTATALTCAGTLTLSPTEDRLYSAVIDATNDYAYFGTYTDPGVVVKVRLSDLTRVGTSTLDTGEDWLTSAVIDTVNGFSYFGAAGRKIVKVRLSDFACVGTLTLDPPEGVGLATIDTANGFAYFGTGGIVVKVRLSDFTRVGTISLYPGESVASAVIDTTNGYAYLGTGGSPGKVVKIRLSDFTRVGALTLNPGENGAYPAVVDTVNGYAYFGARGPESALWQPSIVKVRLSDFTRVGALTLEPGDGSLASAVIDIASGFAYFGTWTSPGIVVKVRLSDFTRVGALTLSPGEGFLSSAVIDAGGGFAYFGTSSIDSPGQPGKVVKVRLSDLTRVGALTLGKGEEGDLRPAVIDTVNGFAYFGTRDDSPSRIVKVRLSDFTRVAALALNPGEDKLASAVIDTMNGYAYFGTETSLGIIVKVRLLDLTRVGALTLNPGEDRLTSAVIDAINGYAYFGTDTSPGVVVKIRLSDLTRVGALTLNPSEDRLTSAVIDTVNGFAYFATSTSPSIIVKVRLSDFTQIGTIALYESNLGLAVIDTVNGFAYFGGSNQIVKIRLSDFTRVGALRLSTDAGNILSAVIDTINGYAYFGREGKWNGRFQGPSSVEAVRLSDFTSAGSLTLASGGYPSSAIIDAVNGFAYFGIRSVADVACKIDKIALDGTVFDFSLSNSGGITVGQGGSASNTITVSLLSGTGQSVALSAGIPTQIAFAVIVSFNPSSGNPTFTSTCAITTSSSVPAGSYTITVIGTGAGVTHTTSFTLTIIEPGQKGSTRIVLDASPKPGYANKPVTIFGTLYGSWRCIRDGVVVGKPVTISTGWGFSTIVTTGENGQFSVQTTCPSKGGTYTVTVTFIEDQDLQQGSQTISLQVLEHIETTLSLSSSPTQYGMGSATKFYGYLKEKQTGAPVAGKTVLLTVLGGGSAWTYTVQTDNNGYYELIYTNNSGIFTWAEARFNGEGMYLPSYSGRLYPR